jgi:hypothetical protein
LPNDARLGRSQRCANRELRLPIGRARQQQIGQVAAAHHEEEADAREHRPENRPVVAHDLGVQRKEVDEVRAAVAAPGIGLER